MQTDELDWWPAPAKLNLTLRITGRRADGYHQLQTVFRLIDFTDHIAFRLRDDGLIQRQFGNREVPESGDLIIRAARLLQRASGTTRGVDLFVQKNIPMGGGLGGGSSNAATVLIALNRLWGIHLPLQQLTQLGLELGADVPVFIHGATAWAEGVGELLQPIDLPPAWYLVLSPDCHVATADVFNDPELTRNSPRTTIRDFLAGSHVNDCLPVVAERYPAVAAALEWLGRFATPRLTGTGGSVFAEFASEDEARERYSKVPGHYRAFVARGLDQSPLRLKDTVMSG